MSDFSKEELRMLLDYDPETGVVRWKRRERSMFPSDRSFNTYNTRFAGRRAGSLWTDYRGYQCRMIFIMGKTRKEHRIIWAWMQGDPVPVEIDHINQDATDNRWKNLRGSSRINNVRNTSKRKDNSSGVTGVSWCKRSRKWLARCSLNGKNKHLGYFSDLDVAAMEAMEFRLDNGFYASHGIEMAHYHREVCRDE